MKRYYAMSKSALQGLSRDLGLRGITINNVQPEAIATVMNPSEGEFAQMLKKHIAVLRYGTVEEVAGLVAYLTGTESV
ncbi:SDR family oxidoreductase [Nostoc sp.]